MSIKERRGLTLYLAYDPALKREPHLIVGRTIDQAIVRAPLGLMVKRASQFEAYRFGKCGVELEYANPRYKELQK